MASGPYPIELPKPDLSPYRRGNVGPDYVHSFDSGKPGPHVMVNALTHGNELCGAVALDFLFRHDLRPRQGRLTLVFANVAAYERFDPEEPSASRCIDEDFNRLWTPETLGGPRQSRELARARELLPVYRSADYLLDIHSMSTFHEPIILCNGLPKERALAQRVGYPAAVACGPVYAEGKRIIDHDMFQDPGDAKTALLVECGQHWAAATGVAALDTALYFLKALDVIDPAFAEANIATKPAPPQRMLDITHGIAAETDSFRFASDFVGLERFPRAGTVIATDGDKDIRTPYDDCILVMPNHRAKQGQRAMRLARQVA